MNRRTLGWLLALMALSLGSAQPALAREVRGFDFAGLQSVARTLERDGAISKIFDACPTDIYKSRALPRGPRFGFSKVREGGCDRNARSCLRACLAGANGNSCFSLARTYQRHPRGLDPLSGERLFSLACANGMAAGCTNRGAGMRNGEYAGDPFAKRPEPERQSCEFKSFTIGCEGDDSWGCAMLGQAFRLGEGTGKSTPDARRAYQKACDLAPEFAACGFAKSGLRELLTPVSFP